MIGYNQLGAGLGGSIDFSHVGWHTPRRLAHGLGDWPMPFGEAILVDLTDLLEQVKLAGSTREEVAIGGGTADQIRLAGSSREQIDLEGQGEEQVAMNLYAALGGKVTP